MVLVEIIIADLAIDKAMKSAARFRHRLHHVHVCLSGADGIIDIMPAIFKLRVTESSVMVNATIPEFPPRFWYLSISPSLINDALKTLSS